ncbi:MAG: 5-methylthioadenosine/S-adenosylhomocysteine deaminase [candidate division WS2 bacterium]|uniref:5-methylthioadenosine/S-adenosylhomocysteine deaminase n=1 Tax=Psychracetigena formicireducens TaxID=2986056 RepID=A0A9E2BJ44_PSYF1|nr:5-methylthioadenosine/S-adenosylhomocysteine deaminase [Candidatus Psychracetigena formicireducens]MBT9145836.1 5-methylthioadenosine/S-adenosylhomocysteine deaminase [Candidatus Psychracetigena formicireducens]
MIIKGTTILNYHNLTVEENRDLLIEDEKIKNIGNNLQEKGEIIDGRNFYCVPGLVNTHSHVAMTLLRGAAEDVNIDEWFNQYIWIYEKNLTPDDVYFGSLLGAAEMLQSGVTMVADHYFYMDRAFDAYKEIGIRANLGWAVFGFGEDSQEKFKRALEFTNKYLGKEKRIDISLAPHSPYLCPDEFLQKNVEVSKTLGIPLHIHVSEEHNQLERSLKIRGITPIEVLDKTGVLQKGTILAHAYYATDTDFDLIKTSGSGVAHCPKTYMKFGDNKNFLPRALRKEINLGLGCDGPCSNNTINIYEAARDAALLAKLSERNASNAKISELLPLLSGGGAKVLGLTNYGEIREGNIADLVLIKKNTPNMVPVNNIFANILYSLDRADVDTVIVDGRKVVEGGKIISIDMEEVIREINTRSARMTIRDSNLPMQNY